jgi:hypothetical protein
MTNSPNRGNGAGIQWIRARVGYQGDDCLIWPFHLCNGYGTLGYLGKQYYAHRFMCELAHGAPPSPDLEAAHSCGRGHLGCTNPRHLSWKTPGENQRDRAGHGTRNVWSWRGKITQAQADEILALKGKRTQAEIAEQFGISRSNVSFIHCGKAWNKGRLRWDKTTAHTEHQRRVVAALKAAGRPLRAEELKAAAGLRSINAASLVLGTLARRGIIEKPARALYQAKSQ